ncbi:MAG: PQQ-binding-like beta-propeller repeat protein, partial [Deltaproteobacteria bacterium]|nr:PQQ-binding-like beta-propeller repeat protein [Deltaproteobacteria bacterium]
LLLEDGRLYAGFTDGAVAAINPADGRLFWEVETSVDVEIRPGNVPQFLDVDTTPVLLQGTLYIASFTAGLYALDADSGTVEWRVSPPPDGCWSSPRPAGVSRSSTCAHAKSNGRRPPSAAPPRRRS